MLYKGGESCIQTNGFLSCFFKLSRSMRQGCPIASYLYILQAEPMAESIRKNKQIIGLETPTPEVNKKSVVKISMFADDTQLFHKTEASIIEGFNTLNLYCRASGAQLNLDKTKGLYIGHWKNKTPIFKKIKWVTKVSGLGAEFGYNINYEEIWMKKFFKFKKKIVNWNQRDLTLKGKKILINSYIMSSLSFLVDIYTSNISSKFIQETRNLIRDFLWGGKTWHISQQNLGLKKTHGGLELQDIDNFILCKKLKWITKIHFSDLSKWNAYGKYCLQKYDVKFNCNNFLLQCSNLQGLSVNIPAFYKTCLDSWSNVLKKEIVTNKEEVLNQNLFGNMHIAKQQKAIFYPHWAQSNFVKIKDIWNVNSNSWENGLTIFNKLTKKCNWIAEYNKIKQYIPHAWKQILLGKEIYDECKMLHNSSIVKLNHVEILRNNEAIELKQIKQKDLYYLCLYPVNIPKCVENWSRVFHQNLTVQDIFTDYNHTFYNRKSVDFHWKTLHRTIFTETKLKAMKKSDGMCKLCYAEEETICHLLYSCNKIHNVWNKLENFLSKLLEDKITLDVKKVILGYKKFNTPDNNDEKIFFNFMVYNTKWSIWKHRNDVKYGNKKIKNVNVIYDTIVKLCKRDANIMLKSNICDSNFNKELRSYMFELTTSN